MDSIISTLICAILGLYLGLPMARFSSSWLAIRLSWCEYDQENFCQAWTICGAIIGFAGAGIPAFSFGISIGLLAAIASTLASVTMPILLWAVMWAIEKFFSSSMALGERLVEMVDHKRPD